MAKRVGSMAKQEITMKQLLDGVKQEMVALTSLPFNTIVGVSKDEETGNPTVTMELVERKAIPDSMDLLGIYEVAVDGEGNVATFRRIGMRKRCDITSGEEY